MKELVPRVNNADLFQFPVIAKILHEEIAVVRVFADKSLHLTGPDDIFELAKWQNGNV